MLPLKNRLKKKKDFENIFAKGKTTKARYFFLKTIETGSLDSRIGFIVSKKVSKKAVERNRTKRLFREAVRLNIARIKPGYDLVFIVLNLAKEKDLTEIKKEIEFILGKNGLLIN
ncbi:MAG: ribonuclease P protein component [Candidatus Paceibacterota bacterium]|jgi:ribonuclease P protein component|nr:ribonuclease P protein component [bacterium]